jgi:hypothetical protein
MLKQFNKKCKDVLKGKTVKSVFAEGKLNERYTFEHDPTDARFHKEYEHFLAELIKAIKGSKNPKAKSLAGRVKAAQGLAKKFTDIVGVRGGHSGGALGKESVAEATDVWKRFDAMQKLQGQGMDIEMDMKNILATMKQLHRDMEQEAEPEGGPKATKYGKQIEKYEKMYKQRKAELKKVFAKLDRLEQF